MQPTMTKEKPKAAWPFMSEEKFTGQTGFDNKTISRWMKKDWIEGIHYLIDGGDIWLNKEAVAEWMHLLSKHGPPVPRWKIIKLPVDDPGATALYRHYDQTGELLYVGISLHSITRQSQHQRGSHWWTQVSRIEIEWYRARYMAEMAEKRAIKNERPKHNIVHAVKDNVSQ